MFTCATCRRQWQDDVLADVDFMGRKICEVCQERRLEWGRKDG